MDKIAIADVWKHMPAALSGPLGEYLDSLDGNASLIETHQDLADAVSVRLVGLVAVDIVRRDNDQG